MANSRMNGKDEKRELGSAPSKLKMNGHEVSEDEIIVVPSGPLAMEGLWAKELSRIQRNEREVNDDKVHGIKSWAVGETPEKITRALNTMQTEINMLPVEEKRAHLRGLKSQSLYTQSKEFRLRFLRATGFNTKDAAIRYCKCLDYLVEVFGEFALTRRLFITDLNEDEISYLHEGNFQLLPSRDCLGRRIVAYNIHPTSRPYSVEIIFKVYAYLLFAIISEDITTQRNGMVYVGVIGKTKLSHGGNHMPRLRRMFGAIPLRWGAVHLCVPNEPVYQVITALFMAWIGQEGRKVLRIHRGYPIECCYSLRSFGIPVEDMPEMQSGQFKKNILRLIKVRMAMDKFAKEQEIVSKKLSRKRGAPSAPKPFLGIECPEINFVILGSSKKNCSQNDKHIGNASFRRIMFANEGFKNYLKDRNEKGEGNSRRAEINKIAEAILYESWLEGLHFVEYNQEQSFFTEMQSIEDIRQKVVTDMRHQRVRHEAEAFAVSKKRNSRGTESSESASFDVSQRAFFTGCV